MGGKLGMNQLGQFKLGDSEAEAAAAAVTGMFDQPTPSGSLYDPATPSGSHYDQPTPS